MLLNMFFGVIANAANGIAMQVNGVLQQFSASITTSIRPQLVKSVGENNMQRMLTLTYAACKYPSLLLALFAIPLVIAMPYVLELWLKDVPANASIFCTLLILVMLFNQLSMGLTTAIEAIGRVKILHLIVGSMHIVSIPAAYIFFKLGFPAPTIFWCIMVEEVIAALFRVILAKKLIGLSFRLYINEVLLRVLFVIATVVICGYYLWDVLPAILLNLIILCVSCTIVYILSMLIFGVNKTERIAIFRMISKGYTRIKTMM
jgi:Na+-driven multidrug efflux pump